MSTVLWVALGGALGAVARYLCVRAFVAWFGAGFPYGTLAVNVVGCIVAGAAFVVLVERSPDAAAWRAVLIVGFLGGFTTFSAFSVETLRLFEGQGLLLALGNVAGNVLLCLLGCASAIWAARQLP